LTETTRTDTRRSSRPNTLRLGVAKNDAKRSQRRPGTDQRSHGDSDGGAGSARRVLRILKEFCQNSPSPTAEELSQATNIPLSSVYRYLTLLREADFIDEDGRNGFVVAPLAVRLARAAMLSMPMIELAEVSKRFGAHQVLRDEGLRVSELRIQIMPSAGEDHDARQRLVTALTRAAFADPRAPRACRLKSCGKRCGPTAERIRCHYPAVDLPQLKFKMCLRHRRFFQ